MLGIPLSLVYTLSSIAVWLIGASIIWLFIGLIQLLVGHYKKKDTQKGKRKIKQGLFFVILFVVLNALLFYYIVANDPFVGCFTSETKVATSGGNKSIEDVQIGDVLLSFENEKLKYSEVTKIYKKQVLETYIINGDLEATRQHPFAVRDGNYIAYKPAEELEIGDLLINSTQENTVIKSIKSKKSIYPIEVYNLETNKPHNFFVQMNGENVLVHNKSFAE